MIRVEGLAKTYGNGRRPIVAVEALNLSVDQGEVFGLLGPNGAGKTTTIRMLCGLVRPTAGRAWIDGIAVDERPNDIRARIGLVPGEAGEILNLTVHEVLEYHGAFYGLSHELIRERSEPLIARLGLADRANDRLGTFSKGMRRKFHLVRALLHRPRVLLLDEPTAGLDPAICETVWELLEALVAELRLSVILCSHHLEEVQRLCRRVGILRRRLLLEGAISELSGSRHRARIELADDAAAVQDVLRQTPGISAVHAAGHALRFTLDGDGRSIIPNAVRALVSAGANIVCVEDDGHDLRALYRSAIAESDESADSAEAEETAETATKET